MNTRNLFHAFAFFFAFAVGANGQPAIPSSVTAPFASPLSTTRENWKEPVAHPDAFEHVAPVVGQADKFGEFTRELVRVEWRPGDPIDLYVVRPVGVAKPPVIIYLYGYPREAVRFLDPEFCKTVTHDGFAAVGFSSMLTGQRYHDVPMKTWFVSELDRSLIGTAHDVQMVLNYLTDRNDFDLSRVGVFGEGSGGTVALISAAADARIKAIDLLNPWGDWESWLMQSKVVPDRERSDFAAKGFLDRLAPLDPVNLLPGIKTPPLRLQQTLWNETEVPVVSRERVASVLGSNATLSRYKNEQEYSDRVGRNGKMLDWLKGRLSLRGEGSVTPSR